MKYTAIKGTSVFIVLEHSWVDKTTRPHTTHDAVIHGIYSTRETANNKKVKVARSAVGGRGYLCTLKRTIEGKKPRVEHWGCPEYSICTYAIKE